MYDRLTWSDIAYQEQHGVLPDKGWDSGYIAECLASGDDPDELCESIRAADEGRMLDELRSLRDENAWLREQLGDGS